MGMDPSRVSIYNITGHARALAGLYRSRVKSSRAGGKEAFFSQCERKPFLAVVLAGGGAWRPSKWVCVHVYDHKACARARRMHERGQGGL